MGGGGGVGPPIPPSGSAHALHSGNSLTDTFTNSEVPDEMPHNAAFHMGLPCLLR